MEDAAWLSPEEKKKMEALKKELTNLKKEHKEFARRVGGLSSEERELWKRNSQRTNEVYLEMKELRFKNIMSAGESGF